MTQQAEILRRIDRIPQKYFTEVIDFLGYVLHKAQQEQQKPSSARDIELFEKYADELNAEAEDVLSYQNMYMDEINK